MHSKSLLLHDSGSYSEKLEEIFFLEMCTPFSSITWVVFKICILFTNAKSGKFPIDCLYSQAVYTLFNPKLRRHNACFFRSGLKFYNLP